MIVIDDDGKAYMFWGSSNVYPIRGMELDKDHRFTKKGETKELFNLDMPKHGWERLVRIIRIQYWAVTLKDPG